MQRQASVVIFGGTSEGRELAEYAESHRDSGSGQRGLRLW